MSPIWLAGSIFLFTYALIVSEKIHRTISSLLGGLAMIIFVGVPQDQAFKAVDWNVIFLLAGMMIIADILRATGLFQWVAFQAVRFGKGDPFRVLIILSLITAIASAFLDNVTIVILIAPVTLFVASALRVNPVPFLIAEILASNIGGMSTLIGDPPNILIGSAAGIDFLTFAANMGPISIIILLVFIAIAPFLFKKELTIQDQEGSTIAELDASGLITDIVLLRKSLIIMGAVMIGFILHGSLHLEPATIALAGATILMLWSNTDPHDALRDIEWTTLFFFIGLFIMVEAVIEVGIIEIVADSVLRLTGGNLKLTSISLIWFSALVSGVVDNIPYTASMIPIIKSLGEAMAPESLVLWWSLALGADLGGNLTLVGAAANVVVASIAEKSGHPISFKHFLRYGVITTVMSLVIASIYVWIRYL